MKKSPFSLIHTNIDYELTKQQDPPLTPERLQVNTARSTILNCPMCREQLRQLTLQSLMINNSLLEKHKNGQDSNFKGLSFVIVTLER